MKKIYLVPNLVTTGNLFCGYYSILETMRGNYSWAAWLVVIAAIFDLLDGRVARMARATSSFGIEYDSLSDLVSFGIAPAVLFYRAAGIMNFGTAGVAASFLFAACGAFRLARFNVSLSSVPKGFFQGLPIPIAAVSLSTFFLFCKKVASVDDSFFQWSSLGLSTALGLLMISSVPFPSFKELNWRSKASFGYLVVAIVAMAFVVTRPDTSLFIITIAYIVLGLLLSLMHVFRSRKHSDHAARGRIEPREN